MNEIAKILKGIEIIEVGVFGNTLIKINSIILIILIIFYTHQHLYALVSTFIKNKPYPKAKKEHSFAYLICARNEEKVIAQLIDSIYKQDYPTHLMHVFVCCDNCSDDTYEICKKTKAIVYERKSNLKGKSYALNFLLDKIKTDHKDLKIDAFFVFDADNLLSKDYTKEMNKALDFGVEVCTSFRDSKNYDVNWISASSAMSFYRECRLVHHARKIFHLGTYVSGTGFYISKNVLDYFNGWHFNTLVEDIEFSINCGLNDIYVGYNEEAVFYDEQPSNLKDSFNQRLRWCKGTHQCFCLYEGKLIKKLLLKLKLTCVDLLIHITPMPLLAFVWLVLYLILMGINTLVLDLPVDFYIQTALASSWSLFFITFLVAFIHAVIVTILLNKRIKAKLYKKIIYAFLFPLYMFFYIPLSFIAVFKNVSWKPIKHDYSKSIDNLEK